MLGQQLIEPLFGLEDLAGMDIDIRSLPLEPGKRLVDHVKTGRDRVQLWTHEPNAAAHRFYHREGFKTVERRAEGRGDGVPELRMEWHA